MSHTPEPWASTGSTIRNSNGRVVIAYLYSKRTRAANMRRILACVNACRGVPTEALERNAGAVNTLLLAAFKREQTVERNDSEHAPDSF